jgi:Spy/CpxP family protein refolding chaperone
MKTKIVILFILIAGTVFSQGFRKHQFGPKERMEQLEKIKLLEVLDLDEETSVRFFARRNEFKEEHHKVMEERQALIFEMEQALRNEKSTDEYNYEETIEKLAELEKKFIQQRIDFINSLDDILTVKQKAKLVVFESKFMGEVRKALMRRGMNE